MEYTEPTDDEKREFARKQYDFLREKGIDDREQLSRIFKSCGPGQIQDAWNLAYCEKWEGDSPGKNLLFCIMTGAIHARLSAKEIFDVLEAAEFKPPQTTNTMRFFRIIKGAREILFPGSHEFNEQELDEIANGL